MSAPKPWQTKATALTTTADAKDIIAPTGAEISANPQALAVNAMQKGDSSTLHKSPASTSPATTAAANATTGSTTANSTMNRSPYNSGYGYNRYGGGMYGGGMYGGGMYSPYSSMYGGMYGSSQGGFLNSMNQYVFSICQAAQMIEYNANGIGGFAVLMKKFFVWIFSGSKTLLMSLGALVISNVSWAREWTKQKVHEYFYQNDLSSQELSKQVQILEKIMKILQIVIGLMVIRFFYLSLKKMVFSK